MRLPLLHAALLITTHSPLPIYNDILHTIPLIDLFEFRVVFFFFFLGFLLSNHLLSFLIGHFWFENPSSDLLFTSLTLSTYVIENHLWLWTCNMSIRFSWFFSNILVIKSLNSSVMKRFFGNESSLFIMFFIISCLFSPVNGYSPNTMQYSIMPIAQMSAARSANWTSFEWSSSFKQ